MRHRTRLFVLLAGTSVLLSGCSSSPDTTSATAPSERVVTPPQETSEHNDLDVLFTTDMVSHHLEGVSMAADAAQRAESPPVRELATRIVQQQQNEADLMNSWLLAWNIPVSSQGAHTHGDEGDVPGMTSHADLDALAGATGSEYDRLWLTLMIEHHEGAMSMAQVEMEEGSDPRVVQLATEIVQTQGPEIEEMKALLPAG